MALLIQRSGLRLPWLMAVLVGGWLGEARAATQPSPNREAEIKAAALYNIVAFTEWPDSAFKSPDAPLVIGVLGQGPVAPLLDQFLANETWHGRRIILRLLAIPEEAKGCHALYIERTEHSRWRAVHGGLPRLPILTVCDAQNFARQGGVVQFSIERSKLRLTVNLGEARSAGLAISSKVLRLAEVLDDPTP